MFLSTFLGYAQRMRYLISILLLSVFSVHAQIYKSVDAEGNVVYTDEPDSKAEEFVPPSMNAIPMPQYEPRAAEEPVPEKKQAAYKDFRITSPTQDATVRMNAGILQVQMSINPALQKQHSIAIYIDDHLLVKNTNQMSVTIPGINRGTHSLYAMIKDDKGKRIKRSNVVIFHMKRHSVLHTPEKANAPQSAQG